MSSGSVEGAQSIITVCAGGSSTVLRRVLAAASVSRSALSRMTMRHLPTVGSMAAGVTTSVRMVSTPMVSSRGVMCTTSVWAPRCTLRHCSQVPQPMMCGLVHSRAAAKATAALDRPDPGGPVKSQAWVIALLPPLPPLAAPSP